MNPPGPGENYYVSPSGSNSNDGTTTATAWQTITYACGTVSAGATVTVLPGTYSETPTCDNSGASGSPITIQAQYPAALNTSNRSILSTSASTEAVVTLGSASAGAGVSYLVINGFEVTGVNASIGIVNWGSHNTTQWNVVHDVATAVTCNDNGGAGIDDANYSSTDDDMTGNVVYNIGPGYGQATNNCLYFHGLYHTNTRGHLFNNIISNGGATAINLNHNPQNVTVANNTIVNSASSACYAVYISSEGSYPVSDYNFFANNVIANGCGGIEEESGGTGSNSYYVNNDFYNLTGSAMKLNGGTEVNRLTSDPGFANDVATGGAPIADYEAASSSSFMVGAGISLTAAGTYHAGISGIVAGSVPTTDLLGQLRPTGSNWDLGAFQR